MPTSRGGMVVTAEEEVIGSAYTSVSVAGSNTNTSGRSRGVSGSRCGVRGGVAAGRGGHAGPYIALYRPYISVKYNVGLSCAADGIHPKGVQRPEVEGRTAANRCFTGAEPSL